jgi:hypothetical protein
VLESDEDRFAHRCSSCGRLSTLSGWIGRSQSAPTSIIDEVATFAAAQMREDDA